MQIGDIKVADGILNLELQVGVLQQIVVYLLDQNTSTLDCPSQKLIEDFKAKTIHQLQIKYPNMGIKKNS